MKKILVGLGLACMAASAQNVERARWTAEASRVTIVRDDWGIAHIHGKSDADAVFGMIYAQCEDDFNRVEKNYLVSLGRTAEVDGEAEIWADLRQRLFLDPGELKQDYAASPAWLQKLMNAWADGINFYLATHKEVTPKVLTRFEPWMALSFTEGSIGGDIERVDLKQLETFYGSAPRRTLPVVSTLLAPSKFQDDPGGSNGIVIAPQNTKNHHALLLINPHTTFYFRSELQMSSDEGINAYGAVTWGQFFVYQGFNERAGWMHTSSGVDAVDEFSETVNKGKYLYGGVEKAIREKLIRLSYKTPQGVKTRNFTTYATSHGPVVRAEGDKWISIKLMNIPIPALEQSFSRTKAHNYREYQASMELKANSSNNTIFADADGDIAYWHGNFIPKRDRRLDYTKPVDGSDPATDWHGLMTLDEVPHLRNPASGFAFNVNDSPWNGAGTSSLKQKDFPAYVEQGIESARGTHAMRLLAPEGKPRTDFTLESFREAAYDSYLPWFARTVPLLVAAFDQLPAGDPMRTKLSSQISSLRSWDCRWGIDSVATSLAIYWGVDLMKTVGPLAQTAQVPSEEWVATRLTSSELLAGLNAASNNLVTDFGKWQIPWGEINRFQRVSDELVQPFDDARASLPVGFPSSIWGSLAAFNARQWPGTRKWYGTYGNSFVAVVEFGPKVRAVAITAGGESGDLKSKHFNDQAPRYAAGDLREIYFYPEQLAGHTESTYKPGGVRDLRP